MLNQSRRVPPLAIIVLIAGLCVMAYGLADMTRKPETAQAESATQQPDTAQPAPVETTPAPAVETRMAAEAELAQLAVEATRVAIQIEQDAAAQAAAIVAKNAELDVQRTAEAITDSNYRQARQDELDRRMLAVTETVVQATLVALEQEVVTMQSKQQVDREMYAYTSVFRELFLPLVSGLVGLLFLRWFVPKLAHWLRELAERERQPEQQEYDTNALEQPAPVAPPAPEPEPVKPLGVALPVDHERLLQFAAALIDDGQALTYRNFTGDGKLFSRSEFDELRKALVNNGLAGMVSQDNSMISLTPAGREYFGKILDTPTPPVD